MSLAHVKLCDVEDFSDAGLLAATADILPERDPARHAERKVWEFAMLALFLESERLLDDATEALAVGAGNERILYWLANRLGRVVATDVYGQGPFANKEAGHQMLTDPDAFAPFAYRRDRLEVRWMDARSLDFDDEAFDVVFSLSSIEHFGAPDEIARAAAEIGRVLRPGGVAFVATEFLVRLHPLDCALADTARRALSLGRRCPTASPRRRVALGEAFTAGELERRIVAPSGLDLVQPLDTSLSERSWENLTVLRGDGSLEPASGSYFPHVLVRVSRSIFTSVSLCLRKPGP